MLAGTEGWQEFLCLSVLAYTGIRRDSASRLRWKDVDLVDGTIACAEKGGKVCGQADVNELWRSFARRSSPTRCRAGRPTT